MRQPFWPLLAAVLAACAGDAPGGPPPFDVRPAMEAVREDAARIARLLAAGALADAVLPARRLAELRLAPGLDAPPRFRELEETFRGKAADLASALQAEDGAAAARSFDDLLLGCAACHATFRPGGAAGR
ncbi:MAG: cytochrome c [Planctomycetes bacterium]|nr:cytochrome c [Planctomycetota bacterium]